MGPLLERGLGYLALDPAETAVSFVRVLAESHTPFLWITSRSVSAPPDGGDLIRVTTLAGAMGTADPRRLQDLRAAATTFFDERGPGALVTHVSLPSTRTYRSSPVIPRLFASRAVMLWRLTTSSFKTTSA